MKPLFSVTILALVGLAGCLPLTPAAPVTAADPALGQGDFVAAPPPPGRTAEDRSARRSYYQGPRGQEF
ncbi:hypothetical protein [Pseudodonghicola flavimaris]|uniref:Lipoprotein n=1 Tax=Pseudodonghicola flavimaris TaxID=3050036 RepID=A0ABT7EYS6_9RHOB|nr:hypothetical protein [Pseudodonghicola flavimaris]MDK3017498.1 hypothetical protein [Pseudodonghicola flavimaris]